MSQPSHRQGANGYIDFHQKRRESSASIHTAAGRFDRHLRRTLQ
jgi:hypothetical protein